jgi:hypothetical protein
MGAPQEIEVGVAYDPVIPLLGVQKNCSRRFCTLVFIISLFTRVREWNGKTKICQWPRTQPSTERKS